MSEEDDQLAAAREYAEGRLCGHGYADGDCPDTGCAFTHQSPPTPVQPTYLGDGVTASYDGRFLVLTADGTKTIYLEPDVYRALVKFAEANGFGGEG